MIEHKLFVVRHGESVYNFERRFAGSSDIPLTEKGILQAKNTAKTLKTKKINRVISSPLIRARQTADIICEALDMNYETMDCFAERYMGLWEGMSFEEAHEKYPGHFNLDSLDSTDYFPPEGEGLIEFCDRVESGLKKLITKELNTLIVCHGLVSRAVNRYFNNLSYDKMHDFLIKNAEIVEFKYNL